MARRKKITIPINLVELEQDNFHLIIDATINDNFIGKWIIDTGASKSVFDINLQQLYIPVDLGNTEIQSAGIGEHKIETFPGKISKIEFGDFVLNNFTIALIDLQHVNTIYGQFTNSTVVGLLGSDVMVKYNAEINLKKNVLILHQ